MHYYSLIVSVYNYIVPILKMLAVENETFIVYAIKIQVYNLLLRQTIGKGLVVI